jgi:hypothetical protein
MIRLSGAHHTPPSEVSIDDETQMKLALQSGRRTISPGNLDLSLSPLRDAGRNDYKQTAKGRFAGSTAVRINVLVSDVLPLCQAS